MTIMSEREISENLCTIAAAARARGLKHAWAYASIHDMGRPVEKICHVRINCQKQDLIGEGETMREAFIAVHKALEDHVPDAQRLADILGFSVLQAAE